MLSSRSVYAVGEGAQPDLAYGKINREVHQVPHGSAETTKFPDNEDATATSMRESISQTGTFNLCPTRLVGEILVASYFVQRVELRVESCSTVATRQ